MLLALLSISLGSNAQFVNHTACDNPSFSSTSIYTFFQPHSKFSIGAETGYWQGETDSRFSFFGGLYFIKIDSSNDIPKGGKVLFTSGANLSVYEKTQIRIIPNYLYQVTSLEIINPLVDNKFEIKAGLRGVIPILEQVGIGIEAGYSYFQKQYYGVFNVHIAFD